MRTRRPARRRRRDAFYRAVQRVRLDRIAEGTLEPRFDREFYFLWTLRSQGRADHADFIVPGLLFMADYQADLDGKAGGAGGAPLPSAPADASPLPEPGGRRADFTPESAPSSATVRHAPKTVKQTCGKSTI